MNREQITDMYWEHVLFKLVINDKFVKMVFFPFMSTDEAIDYCYRRLSNTAQNRFKTQAPRVFG